MVADAAQRHMISCALTSLAGWSADSAPSCIAVEPATHLFSGADMALHFANPAREVVRKVRHLPAPSEGGFACLLSGSFLVNPFSLGPYPWSQVSQSRDFSTTTTTTLRSP